MPKLDMEEVSEAKQLQFFEKQRKQGTKEIHEGFIEAQKSKGNATKMETAIAKIKEGKARRRYAGKQILRLAPPKYWK